MTDTLLAAAHNLRRVLALMPCACVHRWKGNSGERVLVKECQPHQVIREWDEANIKTNGEAK